MLTQMRTRTLSLSPLSRRVGPFPSSPRAIPKCSARSSLLQDVGREFESHVAVTIHSALGETGKKVKNKWDNVLNKNVGFSLLEKVSRVISGESVNVPAEQKRSSDEILNHELSSAVAPQQEEMENNDDSYENVPPAHEDIDEHHQTHTLRQVERTKELQELNQKLALKEELASKLMANINHMSSIRGDHEGNLKELQEQILVLQKEKDELMQALQTAQNHNTTKRTILRNSMTLLSQVVASVATAVDHMSQSVSSSFRAIQSLTKCLNVRFMNVPTLLDIQARTERRENSTHFLKETAHLKQQLSEQRRKRLQELEQKISVLSKKITEQEKIIKMKERNDEKINQLNSEIQQYCFIMFSDEAQFMWDGINNKHNLHVWGHDNSCVMLESNFQCRFSLSMWCGILDDHLLGLFIFPGHLTDEMYLHSLQKQLPQLLEDVPLARRCQCTSNISNVLLTSMHSKSLLGSAIPIVMGWSQGPYHLASQIVYQVKVQTHEELLQHILDVIATIRNERVKLQNATHAGMKQAKVKMIRQMRSENERFRTWKQQREKELIKLRVQDRRRQNELARMERLHTKQQNVLKRKVEEAVAVNKRLKCHTALGTMRLHLDLSRPEPICGSGDPAGRPAEVLQLGVPLGWILDGSCFFVWYLLRDLSGMSEGPFTMKIKHNVKVSTSAKVLLPKFEGLLEAVHSSIHVVGIDLKLFGKARLLSLWFRADI
ncbi:hypothetical protein ANN_17433 [Periplaneta americana]|uniref:Uncharacterized protein n=1 Tax=Periplaneta americana TaxID=6978 RepID=A0ABQ8SV21_PERAM|nr:hypothetical protein ANN_17433 [Periplaneta americana]